MAKIKDGGKITKKRASNKCAEKKSNDWNEKEVVDRVEKKVKGGKAKDVTREDLLGMIKFLTDRICELEGKCSRLENESECCEDVIEDDEMYSSGAPTIEQITKVIGLYNTWLMLISNVRTRVEISDMSPADWIEATWNNNISVRLFGQISTCGDENEDEDEDEYDDDYEYYNMYTD